MFKRSKKGRNLVKMLVIASSITAGLALAPNANAAVTGLHVVSTPEMDSYATTIDVDGMNGWHPDSNSCKETSNSNDNGETVLHSFSTYGWELNWYPSDHSVSSGFGEGPITHGSFTCNMHKTVTTVKVTHPLVWKTFTQHRSGVNTTSRSHSSSCYINGYGSELHLDCWGGSYAQANYGFGLLRDARHISRSISTTAGCCSGHGGSVSKYWSGNTAIVRATGWTGVYVRGVTVSYQHRVRTTKRTTTHTTFHDVGIGQF